MAYRLPMTMRHLQRRTGALLLSGIGNISFDQSIRRLKVTSPRDAIAGDWQAVGQDLRRAIARADTGPKAAQDFRAGFTVACRRP